MNLKEVSFVSDDKIDSLLEFFLISREEVIGGEARVPPSILRRIPNGKFHLVVEGQRVAQSLTIPKIDVLLFWATVFPFCQSLTRAGGESGTIGCPNPNLLTWLLGVVEKNGIGYLKLAKNNSKVTRGQVSHGKILSLPIFRLSLHRYILFTLSEKL